MIEWPGDYYCEAKVLEIGMCNLLTDKFARGVRGHWLERIGFTKAIVTRVGLTVKVAGAHQHDPRPAFNLA
jgi:hypothetical protein